MNRKSLYFALPVASLMITIVPLFAAPEQSSSPSASEQRAMTILKNLSQYLAQTQHFSVTIREGYDAVQESGQKVEFGEIRKLTVSRPDRLRIEAERSDGEKNLVRRLLNNSDIFIFAKGRFPGSLDLSQNLLSFGSPDVTLGIEVMLGEVLHNSVNQLAHAAEAAGQDRLLAQVSEEAFN
jgi:hypothetical protein